MEDPALLLQLVRERVTASIVLQRRVPVRDPLGLTVIGRRSPVGGPVAWMHAYDPGLDPDDPEVAAVADLALAQAQAEVGDVPSPVVEERASASASKPLDASPAAVRRSSLLVWSIPSSMCLRSTTQTTSDRGGRLSADEAPEPDLANPALLASVCGRDPL